MEISLDLVEKIVTYIGWPAFFLLLSWYLVLKEHVVLGREYRKVLKDCEYHKEAHERLLGNLEQSLGVAERVTKRVKRSRPSEEG